MTVLFVLMFLGFLVGFGLTWKPGLGLPVWVIFLCITLFMYHFYQMHTRAFGNPDIGIFGGSIFFGGFIGAMVCEPIRFVTMRWYYGK